MRHRLKAKGWSEDELQHLDDHFDLKKEHVGVVFLGLLLLTFGLVVIPYIWALIGQVLVNSLFYIALIFIGVPLGAMYGFLLIDFDRVQKRHHAVILGAVPVLLFFTAYTSFQLVDQAATLGAFTHNAIIGAFTYAISFTVPYAGIVMHEWNWRIGQSNT